ncbi:LmbE family N-acetylglucosaminyl deacetylase [Tamaricihabitans halophyticus]|uniref:LmbE family N-acetylglucosaminyl deacetylase n=1 Tax=Tamaricihabitans halophyticus TaxID=1262583 RepID=A0A4R2QCP1_9PSEU|nr:PIG-L deacetylase family protein [Tamaricihabitans halophyticus]TCP46727.1 LmbE family N-acetylglucosaminyl deacetylase [Tamaricihabitans halophyticus]
MTEQEQGAELAPMPEDWQRALAVVAHPDDMEYGSAGAVAKWTDEGRSVAYLLASKGEAGIDGMSPEEAGPLRVQEQIASSAVVGVHDVEFLDHPDGVITDQLALRRDFAAAIRRYRPELVITVNHREYFPGGMFNMADHRHVGTAVLDAVRDAANRWVFRDLELPPWQGVRWIAIGGSTMDTHAVDISTTMDRAVASLREHRAYLAALGEHGMADPAPFLREHAEETGKRFGGVLATSFELMPV